ncbi:magnesium transporter CorA family protein [Arcobacter arenosus]|uniref:Magnesium transporter CorA family protein n=1 Tax=Arcobacter arenosus TaxID=2576037 RepID=A0A5R8Y0T4_9BACT|nr:magnesium transporter CorA family protein [Arcobacter arenosus]TLP37851.1 magnesium transporter CorA family protein [Arcobacter arenosus]
MTHTNLDNFHLVDIKNPIHPSIFYDDNEYDLFILRLPQIKNDSFDLHSYAFIITEESYYYYDKNKDAFNDLKDFKHFYHFLNKLINTTMKLTTSFSSSISDLEELVYQEKTHKNFNSIWFSHKNDLIRINRVLLKAIDALEDIMFKYKNEDDYLERNFADIQEHIQRANRNIEHSLEKLDTLFSFYQTQVNEQSNKIVYILTLLSGIFLPLNFIVGFFGMNTTSLPFTKEDGGTLTVVLILIIAALISTLITLLMRRR